jgi:hypothetical protein
MRISAGQVALPVYETSADKKDWNKTTGKKPDYKKEK